MEYIAGYEGLYAVTVDGMVWSYDAGGKNNNAKKKGFLKQQKNADGYLKVNLKKNKTQKQCKVHRLVAKAFIPNPENKRCINHMDLNKENNNISNLEWCTHKENTDHYLKYKNSLSGAGHALD